MIREDPSGASVFDRFAEAFPLVSDERERWAREGPYLTRLIRQSGAMKGRVLDLGCGSGFHARQLAGQGFHVCALDLSIPAIRTGRDLPNGPGVLWVRGDIREPYPGIFDTVLLLGNTLSLLDAEADVRRVFGHVSEALADNGVFLLHVIDFDYLDKHPVVIEKTGRVHGEAAGFKKTITRTQGGAMIHISVTLHRDAGSHTEKGSQALTNHSPAFLRRCAVEAHLSLAKEAAGFDWAERPRGQTKDRLFLFHLTES